MSHSYAEKVTLSCPNCGQAFQADLWLIVDAGERPDLVERIRQGTLHTFTCPHCGNTGEVDAPLLLFGPHLSPAAFGGTPAPLPPGGRGE
ncbi:MAG: CpXC domain-containing protein, partial [Anaerolineae bacterium]|nr:CpXC domain-containing protein [Anaerolineae bacterium]